MDDEEVTFELDKDDITYYLFVFWISITLESK